MCRSLVKLDDFKIGVCKYFTYPDLQYTEPASHHLAIAVSMDDIMVKTGVGDLTVE